MAQQVLENALLGIVEFYRLSRAFDVLMYFFNLQALEISKFYFITEDAV